MKLGAACLLLAVGCRHLRRFGISGMSGPSRTCRNKQRKPASCSILESLPMPRRSLPTFVCIAMALKHLRGSTGGPVQAEEKSIVPLNLGQRGGQTVFDAAMPEANYSDIQLAVTGQNFIATVTVSGSQAESGSRETKLGAYTIFDLTRQKLGRSTVLHLPESDFRYLHFRIAGPLAPESINGLSVMRLPAEPA